MGAASAAEAVHGKLAHDMNQLHVSLKSNLRNCWCVLLLPAEQACVQRADMMCMHDSLGTTSHDCAHVLGVGWQSCKLMQQTNCSMSGIAVTMVMVMVIRQ